MQRTKNGGWWRVFGAAAVALSLTTSAVAASTIKLLETGSTLLYPLFNLWVPAYTKYHGDVQITTQGTGSGTGISEAISGVAQIGASDAYMSNAAVKQYPNMLNIPLAISSQIIAYNLPGLNKIHLRLSGPVLAGIYMGKIKYWNNPAIRRLNPHVRLPHHVIIPVHRTDGSGDTFIFTQYLSFSTPLWNRQVGYGTTVSWPALPTLVGAVGNPGMVEALKRTPYTVAYVGISWLDQINRYGLGYAALENRAGRFVLPTLTTIRDAANVMVPRTPKDERVSLVYAPGPDSYPIINYEYAIVNRKQPNARIAAALRAFLSWAVNPKEGNSYLFLGKVHFLPLPPSILPKSEAQIREIR